MTDTSHQFGTIDLTTGVFTPIATLSVNIYGLGVNSQGILYGTDAKTPADVYIINPVTGAEKEIGASTGFSAYGSTVGPNGLLYAVSPGASAAFFTIDPRTLATKVINPSLGFPTYGLAVFNGGEFYTDIYDSGNSLLMRVDPSTGVAALVGPGVGAPAYAGTIVGNSLYAIGARCVAGCNLVRQRSGARNRFPDDPLSPPPGFHLPKTCPDISYL